MKIKSSNPNLMATALHYAKYGIPVVPLHGKKKGKCTCDKAYCRKPGAHPRTDRGVDDATTDASVIREYWTKWPKANIGVATGAPDIIAVKVKTRARTLPTDEWSQRTARWAEWEEEHGLPRTVMFYTGRRDVLLFKSTNDRIRGKMEIAEGITVSGIGEYVRLPRSCDSTAKFSFYATCAPGETDIAPVPRWLDHIISFTAIVDCDIEQPGFETKAVPADWIGVASKALDQEKVRLIAESFEVTGIRTPLFIRPTELGYQFELLSDPHEFEAMKLHGVTLFPCFLLHLSDLNGRLWQIAQLLNQPKLLVLDWAELVVEWVGLVNIKAAQVAHRRGGVQPHDKGYSLGGRVLGVSRRDVERAHTIASIRADAKAEIRRLNLNVKRQLVRIGAAPEEIHLAMVYELTRDRTSEAFEDGVEPESPAAPEDVAEQEESAGEAAQGSAAEDEPVESPATAPDADGSGATTDPTVIRQALALAWHRHCAVSWTELPGALQREFVLQTLGYVVVSPDETVVREQEPVEESDPGDAPGAST